VLVAQPAAMSHGLTLTAASTIVWYAPVTSHDVYQQANARITRPGQKLTQFIVHLEGTEVERRIYKRLQGKEKMQGLLLETVKENFR
jgi:SNF2 family DNA or RNA helicase